MDLTVAFLSLWMWAPRREQGKWKAASQLLFSSYLDPSRLLRTFRLKRVLSILSTIGLC